MRVLHDISEEKEVEQLKTQFVSIASHQLRTPLSGLKWAFHMMLDGNYGPLTVEQKELLKKTLTTNDNLIRLVNDLLDVSRLEEGRFEFRFGAVDIYELTQEIVKELDANIKAGELNVGLEKPDKNAVVEADRDKIKMVLQNIIDNAVKYTPRGGFVKVKIVPRDVSVIFSVQDTGIGIAKEDQKFIFNKFFRARNAIMLQTSGSGLGLYIAKELTKHHNGRIWFDSEENKGSTFYIQLPVKQVAKSIHKTPVP